ncbi:hypothetical protein GQ55_2G238600 [Panicum hallii var. hallii]|uniref:Uncharacterized protein n=1 Tax=Panicum hallii var. hallii TaxID=1504633 RepID=A0A2T7ERR5_9POAL|nr:hypothetical protein GQ55_2G238600 [Panicum hallii var. hallii]
MLLRLSKGTIPDLEQSARVLILVAIESFFKSTSRKYIGCKVKISGSEYTCGSINNCGGTMSTNKWVADRAVDLLRDNHEMGPRELLDMYSCFVGLVCGNMIWI